MCLVLRPAPAVSEKYEFMESLVTGDGSYEFPVVFMCARLRVSRSGFYEWRDRAMSATARRRADIGRLVELSFAGSDETYGYRRVHAELARWDVDCSPELVRSIMRELGLVPCQPRPWRHSLTEAGADVGPIPDLVNRDFTADVPGARMVGSGGRGELHPPAPTEPCVTVSRHTALTIQSARILSSTSSVRTVGSHAR